MKPGEGVIPPHPMKRIVVTVFAAMTLGFSAASLAADAATAPTPDAAIPRVSHHHPGRRLTVAQSIDESVRRLAHGLNLDLGQQVRLRQILVDQHQQMMQLRSRGPGISGDVTVATMAIYDQAKARIRTMLTAEQLKKYPAVVPRDQTAPAQADLQHWMQLQESGRKQDAGASR